MIYPDHTTQTSEERNLEQQPTSFLPVLGDAHEDEKPQLRIEIDLARQEASVHRRRSSTEVQGDISSHQLKTIEGSPMDTHHFNAVQRVSEHLTSSSSQVPQQICRPKPRRLIPLNILQAVSEARAPINLVHTTSSENANLVPPPPETMPHVEEMQKYTEVRPTSSGTEQRSEAQKALSRELRDCIIVGNLEKFKNLSDLLADINQPLELEGAEKDSSLAWAVSEKQLPICKYLIEERGASIDTREGLDEGAPPMIIRALNFSVEGYSPEVIQTLENNSIRLARYLLSQGAFLNEPFLYYDRKGSPTTYYATIGDTKRLQILVERFEADVNTKDTEGGSPLYYILERLSYDRDHKNLQNLKNAARLLVDYDADVDETDDYGVSLLMKLAGKGCFLGVRMLASDFAANTQSTNRFREDVLTIVLNSLEKPNLTRFEMRTFKKLFNYLMPTTSKEHLKMKFGEQVRLGNKRACSLLLKSCRFNIDEPIDPEENTYLLYFTKKGKIEHIKMLLKLGADPQIINHSRESAYSYADKKCRESDQDSEINWEAISQVLMHSMDIGVDMEDDET